MKRLGQLRGPEKRHQAESTRPERDIEDEEDIADFYQYIPRRRGDFPQLSQRPHDTPPTHTRYEIVDRVFDTHEEPIYIIRPRAPPSAEVEVGWIPSAPLAGASADDGGTKALHPAVSLIEPRGSKQMRTPSSTSTPKSVTTVTSDTEKTSSRPRLSYDPDEASLLRVGLSRVEAYVTPRELEQYETWRFENPQDVDTPKMNADRLHARDERQRLMDRATRVESEPEVKEVKKDGRHPKRLKRSDPIVVIYSHGEVEDFSGSSKARSEVSSAAGSPAQLGEAMTLDGIAPSIELVANDELYGNAVTEKFDHEQEARSGTTHSIELVRSSARINSSSMSQLLHDNKLSQDISIRGANGRISASARLSIARSSTNSATSNHLSENVGARNPSQLLLQSERSAQATRKSSPSKTSAQPLSKVELAEHHMGDVAPGASPAAESSFSGRNHAEGRVNANKTQHNEAQLHEVEDQEETSGEDYEISHIIDHDDRLGERYYLVSWVGYSDADATWLMEHELEDAQELLQEYLATLAPVGLD